MIRTITHEFQACCFLCSAVPHLVLLQSSFFKDGKQRLQTSLIFALLIKRNSDKDCIGEGFDDFQENSFLVQPSVSVWACFPNILKFVFNHSFST